MSSWTFNAVVPPLLVLFVGWLGYSSTRSPSKTTTEFFYPSKPYPIHIRKPSTEKSDSETAAPAEDQQRPTHTDLPPPTTPNIGASTLLDKSYIFVPPSPDSEDDEKRDFGRAPLTPSSRSQSPPQDPIGTQEKELESPERTDLEELDIRSFLQRFVPSLFAKGGFQPIWWLPNGHFQTIFSAYGDFSKIEKVRYERTLLRLPDGGTIGLDTTPLSSSASLPPNTPTIVVAHGLTGGSHESYIRNILSKACAPKSEGGFGYRGIVVNSRGCAGVPITSPQWYSIGTTDDLRSALLYISAKYPDAPLVGLGFSLGANVVTRYLGEEGPLSRLRGGIALACPWDTKKNGHRLEYEWVARNVYSKSLGSNQLALFKAHIDKLQSFTNDTRLKPKIPTLLGLQKPTLWQIDEHLIGIAGGNSPPFPFKDVDSYYEWASSHHSLSTINVPFLAISSADDPIVGYVPRDEAQQSKTSALVITPNGGHLGWFQDPSVSLAPSPTDSQIRAFQMGTSPPPTRWVREPTLEFIRAVAEDYVPPSSFGPGRPLDGQDRVERNGWVMAMGSDVIGYQVINEHAEIVRGEEGEEGVRVAGVVAGL